MAADTTSYSVHDGIDQLFLDGGVAFPNLWHVNVGHLMPIRTRIQLLMVTSNNVGWKETAEDM